MRTVRDLNSGRMIELPPSPLRGGEWYKAAKSAGVFDARGGLTIQRQAKPVSGKSVQKVMRAYADLTHRTEGTDPYIGFELLAERTGLSGNTVRRSQQWLIENGWLILTARFKFGKHGWIVVLAIPSDDYDSGAFRWGDIHPKRKRTWDSNHAE